MCLRNYLRMRGEYATVLRGLRIKPELPPHARRILQNELGQPN